MTFSAQMCSEVLPAMGTDASFVILQLREKESDVMKLSYIQFMHMLLTSNG